MSSEFLIRACELAAIKVAAEPYNYKLNSAAIYMVLAGGRRDRARE
jgi:hypothetical protein